MSKGAVNTKYVPQQGYIEVVAIRPNDIFPTGPSRSFDAWVHRHSPNRTDRHAVYLHEGSWEFISYMIEQATYDVRLWKHPEQEPPHCVPSPTTPEAGE